MFVFLLSDEFLFFFFFENLQLIGSVAAASFQKDNHSVDGNNEELLEQENGRPGKFLNFSGEKPVTPILDTINFPIHMKNLSLQVKIKLKRNK